MTRFFPCAFVLMLFIPRAHAEMEVITLPKDQCMAMDKNNDPVSDVVDEDGNVMTRFVDDKGRMIDGKRRDPSAAVECAYVVCGGPKDPNHVTACKTGKKEVPPATSEGLLPMFYRAMTPEQKRNMKITTPVATIGIRG